MNIDNLKNAEIFVFLALILLFLVIFLEFDFRKAEEEVHKKDAYISDIKAEVENKDEQIRDLQAQIDEDQKQYGTKVIELVETNEDYRFPLGSAEITKEFQKALEQEIIPKLKRETAKCKCDLLEVIGHTDRLYISKKYSNLDEELVAAFNEVNNDELVPGSNLDLGMMRALSIVRFLKKAQKEGKLQQEGEPGHIRYFLPYSAGQMLRNDYTLEDNPKSEDNENRRRIEMRLMQYITLKKVN